MSIEDERDLREKLGAALDDLGPQPLPLQVVMRRGRAVVIRRRLAVVAAAAAVIAAAVASPALLRAIHRTPPTSPRYHVTVRQPGPGSPQNLVASGLVNRARWKLTARTNTRHSQTCIASIRGDVNCNIGVPARGLAGPPASLYTDPNEFARLPDGRAVRVQMLDGYVRHDVDRVRVDLTNGQVLMLHPVAALGSQYARWVAFAVPFAAAVREVTVYSASRELEHTVPFSGAGSIEIVRWLAPSQPALPRPSIGRVGTGTISGRQWSVRGYIGPWGSCFTSPAVQMDLCNTRSGPLPAGTVLTRLVTAHSGQMSLSVLQVEPKVSYLLVARAGGSAVRLRPEVLAGQKYCVLPYDDQNNDVSWTAYSADGRLLGHGSIAALLH